jgi:hypothetical protein
MMRLTAVALVLLTFVSPSAPAAPDPLEGQARRFVMLATSLGHLHPREIDAYWGPSDLDMRSKGDAPSLPDLRRQLLQLRRDVDQGPPSPRRSRLAGRLDHLIALLKVIEKPRAMSFAEQARQVYGMTTPALDSRDHARAMKRLDRVLPGHGDLMPRLAAWRGKFVIPIERRKTVFLRALARCRTATAAHWPLPADERLDTVWRSDVPAAWHRYQGHHRSLLQINPEAVADPASVLEVACHEAYPGHHAQFLAMDASGKKLFVEDTVVLLRSPEQMLREGAASYGADLAFPDLARLTFMRDILFPLAGFDPREAASFLEVDRALADLALWATPILRDYYDGRITSGDAMARLMLDAQISSPQALLEYTRDMGAYVNGYAAAGQLVVQCVAARAKNSDRWSVLRAVVGDMDVSVLDSSRPACGRRSSEIGDRRKHEGKGGALGTLRASAFRGE